MRRAYTVFRQIDLGDPTARLPVGPFAGVYAPDQPRRAAERIGPGRATPRRPTVAELVAQLDSLTPSVRADAVRRLPSGPWQRDASGRSAGLVATLTRVLTTDDDVAVRCAAADLLGTVGDTTAGPALLAVLRKADVTAAEATCAACALRSLTLRCPRPPGFADVLVAYLSKPRDPTSASSTLHLLEDDGDPRIVDVARRLLDGDVDAQLRFQAALSVARSSATAADELAARLADRRPAVRAAAAAAVREAKSWDDRVIKALRRLVDDPDEGVRMQSAVSVRMMTAKGIDRSDDQG